MGVDLFQAELDAMASLHAAKREDYTRGQDDLLYNYRQSAALAGIPIETGMFTRMCEKIIRLSCLLGDEKPPAVKDESITDTLRDVAIIALLLRIELNSQGRPVPELVEAVNQIFSSSLTAPLPPVRISSAWGAEL